LLLLPQFPLGSNYQLDELRRVLLRIDIASNAQLVADIKIRWVHISSQLVDRRGLLTRIDIQKTHSRCRLVHSSSRSRLCLLSTIHKNHIPKSPHSKPNISLLITHSTSGHRLSLSSSGRWFYPNSSRDHLSKRLVVVTQYEGSTFLSYVPKYRSSLGPSELRASQRPTSSNREIKVANLYICSYSVS